MVQIDVPPLGDLLVRANLISVDNLQIACRKHSESGRSFALVLTELGYVTENQIADILCRERDFDFISFADIQPQLEAVRMVPETVASRYCAMAIGLPGKGRLSVAMADPLSKEAIRELSDITGREIEPRVALISQIKKCIEKHYSINSAVKAAVDEAEEINEVPSQRTAAAEAADAAPVAKLVDSIMYQAAEEKASDIHIEPGEERTRVRFRVDGSLFSALDIPASLHTQVTARIKILSGLDIAEKRRPQDGRILLKNNGMHIDMRVSTMPSVYGEKTVMRLLNQNTTIPNAASLGFSAEQRQKILGAISASNGIVLVTGPTGSGKSTTLYALLNVLNRPTKNIITLEDPVEITMAGLTQVQINEKIGLTFGQCLRAVLRQDPDIVMVGEIRDTETAQLAVRAALTGHLVLSTLHTNDAASAISRLVDMGVPKFLIASSLRAVVAQRLVRTLCPNCKGRVTVPKSAARDASIPEDTKIWKPVGCADCRGTGYKGRTVIAEVMPVTSAMRSLIIQGASEAELRSCAIEEGMTLLRGDAKRKVLDGVTSVDEMLVTTLAE